MSEWKQYRKKGYTEIRPYVPGEPLTDVVIGSPKPGDYIGRMPDNHNDQWLITKEFFEDNYEPLDPTQS